MKERKPPEPGQVVQLFRLAQESDPELATFIMLAASSGARRGELLALRWSDTDLDRGTLSIERGMVRVGVSLVEQSTKTHQSRRISLDSGRSLRCGSIIGRRRSEPDWPGPRSHRGARIKLCHRRAEPEYPIQLGGRSGREHNSQLGVRQSSPKVL